MEKKAQKEFYIIMGKPGSGKGTQAQLLKKLLEEKHEEVIHVTTGGSFREFMQGDGFVAQQARELQDAGGLQPEFLSIWNWCNVFINRLNENTTVILDGAPRKLVEVEALHDLFPFLGYKIPRVIHIDVTDEWARDRQNYRQAQGGEIRADASSDEEINKRLALFEERIVPCINLLSKDSRYEFHHINGEQSIEEVHAEIMSKLSV